MNIEFKNGSRIEAIESDCMSVKSERSKLIYHYNETIITKTINAIKRYCCQIINIVKNK